MRDQYGRMYCLMSDPLYIYNTVESPPHQHLHAKSAHEPDDFEAKHDITHILTFSCMNTQFEPFIVLHGNKSPPPPPPPQVIATP